MDFISVFIASILFCFFASNYSKKYKTEKSLVNEHIEVSVIISGISEFFIIYGYLNDASIAFWGGAITFMVITFFHIYVSILKLNYFNKDKMGKSIYECVMLSIKNLFIIVGAPICLIQKIIELIFGLIIYNE